MQVKLVNKDIRSNYVRNLLDEYGIKDVEEYICPTSAALQPPTNLTNIKEGFELYDRVCKENGKILLIIDSDVDGFTSAAIFYLYTKRHFPNVNIEYRLHEGKQHGLEDHID